MRRSHTSHAPLSDRGNVPRLIPATSTIVFLFLSLFPVTQIFRRLGQMDVGTVDSVDTQRIMSTGGAEAACPLVREDRVGEGEFEVLHESHTETALEKSASKSRNTGGDESGGTMDDSTSGSAKEEAVAEVAVEDVNNMSGMKTFIIWSALALGALCCFLDEGIISTAIPRITDQFHSLPDVGVSPPPFSISIPNTSNKNPSGTARRIT